MNKGLEALERLVDGNLNEVNYYRQFCDSTTYIMKDKETVEKELKVLEIIINKEVDIRTFKRTCLKCDYDFYVKHNQHIMFGMSNELLTKEEFYSIQEVLL